MRSIGTTNNEDQAFFFRDYLITHGISCDVEEDRAGEWDIWVYQENVLEECRNLFEQFKKDPDADFFKQRMTVKPVAEEREVIVEEPQIKAGIVTKILCALSVLAAAIVILELSDDIFYALLYIPLPEFLQTEQQLVEFMDNRGLFPPVIESWRVFTPMFIHFSAMHIIFNMMWLLDFGAQLEKRRGAIYFISMVLIISALSNFAQNFAGSLIFGGMSGVNYGLFGYIWMRTWRDKSCGLYIHKNNVWMLVGWFFVCLVGIMPNVANAAHGAGLVVGMAWGIFDAMRLGRGKEVLQDY